MVKFNISMFLVCILFIQSGCDSGRFKDWVLSKTFFSQVDKTELEKQKDDRIFTQWKTMMVEEY